MDVDMVSKVGFFHPLFFHYGEDNNYLQRVKYWKYKIMVTNKLHIVHIGYAGKQTVVYNYEGYHKLSYKAHFLVRFLDVNENFSPEKLIQNIFKDFYTLLLLILKFRLKIVNNLFKIIIWKFKLFFILRAEHGYQKFIPTKDEI
jgi:GT2 family glycosyltransferase